MKPISLLSFLLIVSIWANAQDKNAEAQVHYLTAEDAYTAGGIDNLNKCISELKVSEQLLDKTNSKILYLKLKALDQLSPSGNYYYFHDIDSNLTVFFNITDANTYPIEKYAEVIKIKDRISNEKQTIGATSYNHYISNEYKFSDTALFDLANFYLGKNTKPQTVSMTTMSVATMPRKPEWSSLSENELQGEKILGVLARKGNISACLTLAKMYKEHVQLGNEKKYYEIAANFGSSKAMRELAQFYMDEHLDNYKSKEERKEALLLSQQWTQKAKEAEQSKN